MLSGKSLFVIFTEKDTSRRSHALIIANLAFSSFQDPPLDPCACHVRYGGRRVGRLFVDSLLCRSLSFSCSASFFRGFYIRSLWTFL